MNQADGSGVKSAERALSILELFSVRDTALTFTQVAEKLGYPRSSLHGLLRTLTARGWLDFDGATRRFSLGLRAWEAGDACRTVADLVRHAAPVLEWLAASFDGNLRLAVLDGAESVAVLGRSSPLGARAAAHATAAGKVLLADLGRAEWERRLGTAPAQLTPQTLTDIEPLHAALDETRGQGFGWDDGESREGRRSLAVAVHDGSGAVAAALEVSLPATQLAEERREEALRLLRHGAEQISVALGYGRPA